MYSVLKNGPENEPDFPLETKKNPLICLSTSARCQKVFARFFLMAEYDNQAVFGILNSLPNFLTLERSNFYL